MSVFLVFVWIIWFSFRFLAVGLWLLQRNGRSSLQEATEVLWLVEFRFLQQQVAFWKEVGGHQPYVASQAESHVDDGLVLVAQAGVDGDEDHPDHTVQQRGEGDVPRQVVLVHGFHRHEGAHEGDQRHARVEALHEAQTQQLHGARQELRHKVNVHIGKILRQ